MEYIDRFIIGGLVDSHNNVHYEDIKGIPTADVVERSKIDKAIEEIEKQTPELYGYKNQKATQFFLEKQTVIEIIKRNIGE